MVFKEVTSRPDYAKQEEKILAFWQEQEIFKKSLQKTKNGERFVFYEGPPTANGKPHIGHVLARSFKDLFPRFKTMRGFYVNRKAGWDSHGLPVELEVEKELGISGKQEIEELGVEKFNQLCRESVFRYINIWEQMTARMGYWLDMENPYVVLESEYIESLWWVLSQAWEKDLLVKDYKVTPYCPRCQTPISSHELSQGYQDNIADPSVFIKFKIRPQESQNQEQFLVPDDTEAFLLAWTTTPWTLLGNVALAVDPEAEYVVVEENGEKLILAEERLSDVLPDKNPKMLKKLKGQELLGLKYEPLYDFVTYKQKAHYVVPADFIDLNEGSGIVHTAVMYGEEDFQLGQKYNLPQKHLVNEGGQFIKEAGQFAGEDVWEANNKVIEDLKSKERLHRAETIHHTYPYCWRCKTKLIYYALESWFIKMTQVREQLLQNNARVNWQPGHLKNGRMGDWLENVKDWSISRWRYWGTPLPIWHCDSCERDEIIGSFRELRERATQKINTENFDPHRPYIDKITLECPNCKEAMQRYEDVVDTWLDSGGMPYAQWHYPFENQEIFEQQFPADFICEGIDQTRGWFYTLLAEATVLGKGAPYKTVLSTELVLDEKGQKMSKSVGNVIDPGEIFDEFGADTMRWYFYSTSQIGKPYRLGKRDLQEITRRFFNIFWNSYRFFLTNANLDDWSPSKNYEVHSRPWEQFVKKVEQTEDPPILDRWLILKVNQLVEGVTDNLENYNAYEASNTISEFVTADFSQWYLRRSRDRVGPTAPDGPDKEAFYATAYHTLLTLASLLAPFTPFLAEEIYQNLKTDPMPESVHLTDWPEVRKELIDQELEEQMQLAREIVEKGHAARKREGIKVRQPLARVTVSNLPFRLPKDLKLLIRQELNIKEVRFSDAQGDSLQVILDTQITDRLQREGYMREILRAGQSLRRKGGYNFDDKISVYYSGDSKLTSVIKEFSGELKQNLLARDLIEVDTPESPEFPQDPHPSDKLTLNEATLHLATQKA